MKEKGRSDVWLLSCTVLLVFIGMLAVFSSSFYTAIQEFGNQYYFFRKNLIWAIIGFVAMAVFARVPYTQWKKVSGPLVLATIVMLLLIFTPMGIRINEATRWIGIRNTITIMPGEVAKFAVILFMATGLSKIKGSLYNLTKLMPYIAVIGIIEFLILKQPNFSTVVTIFLLVFVMLFVAEFPMLYIIAGGALGAVAGAILIKSKEYRMARFLAFLDPFKHPDDKGFQVIQSLLALGSGGVFGVGLGESVQNKLYMPEPQNDFIFATIGEEFGYLGTAVIVLLFSLLAWRGIKAAIKCQDRFGFLLGTGIVAIISVQALINVAVATSSIPVTGVPLPFISYGGNNLTLLMGQVGILLNISKYSQSKRSNDGAKTNGVRKR